LSTSATGRWLASSTDFGIRVPTLRFARLFGKGCVGGQCTLSYRDAYPRHAWSDVGQTDVGSQPSSDKPKQERRAEAQSGSSDSDVGALFIR
jgi:hypothetical protein